MTVAKKTGCTLIHPGYGFLSENIDFARKCREEGIIFVGPDPEVIELFGNKIIARQTAHQAGVPVIPGMSKPASLEEAIAFFETLPKGDAMMIKAMAGGGGKGMRVVKGISRK